MLFLVSVSLLIFTRVKTDGLKDLGQLCNRRIYCERCQIWGPSTAKDRIFGLTVDSAAQQPKPSLYF